MGASVFASFGRSACGSFRLLHFKVEKGMTSVEETNRKPFNKMTVQEVKEIIEKEFDSEVAQKFEGKTFLE